MRAGQIAGLVAAMFVLGATPVHGQHASPRLLPLEPPPIAVTAGIIRSHGVPSADEWQDVAEPSRPPTPLVVIGAFVGSAAGIVGGVAAERGVRGQVQSNQVGEDAGFGEDLAAGFTGAFLGTAIGTHVGALASGQESSFGRRLRDSMIGSIVGILAGLGVSQMSDGSTPIFIAFSVGQASYAALSNGRW